MATPWVRSSDGSSVDPFAAPIEGPVRVQAEIASDRMRLCGSALDGLGIWEFELVMRNGQERAAYW